MNEFSTHVVEVLEDAISTYGELEETLPGFLNSNPDPRYDTDVLKIYRSASVTMARILAIANRNIDDFRVNGVLEEQEILVLQPIMRMIGESFLLLALCEGRDDMKKAPLVDPSLIKRMLQNDKVINVRKAYKENSQS